MMVMPRCAPDTAIIRTAPGLIAVTRPPSSTDAMLPSAENQRTEALAMRIPPSVNTTALICTEDSTASSNALGVTSTRAGWLWACRAARMNKLEANPMARRSGWR